VLRKYFYAAPLLLFLLVIVESTALAGARGILLLGIACWFALPGVLLVERALRAAGTAVLVGPIIGIGFSVFGLLLLWAAGVQTWVALILAPLFTFGSALVAHRCGGTRTVLPAIDRRDAAAVAVALLLVPLITWAPYAGIRAPTEKGEAYRAYFTADFVWAMAVTSEIAKGDVPPMNPFHHGEPMRYYWLSHMLAGAEYRVLQPHGVSTEPILLIAGVAHGLAFIAFAYWLARAIGATPIWALAAVGAGFIANSYEGADMIRAIVSHHDAWETLRDTNIDAVTRWYYKGMAVDGLHRLLLYQPHHLTGYALALSSLWVVTLAKDVTEVSVSLWAGFLLGLALLFSTFGALIISVAVALAYTWRLLQQRTLRLLPQCAILTGGPLVVGVALTRVLGYTNPADGLLMTLGLNPVATHDWAWVMFLSFGPLLLVGVPALLRPHWVRGAGTAPAALALAAVGFYFLIDVPDMGGVWVGWRSGHMLQLAFALAAASALTALWVQVHSRAAVAVVLAVATLLAVPTVALDVFNAQDIENEHDGAGFPWTLVITPAEREAFDWIRAHTPEDAIVQAEPFVRDPATWAYVPAFAERRMAAGLPISMVPYRHYAMASDTVRVGVFRADSADAAHEWAEVMTIDYLLIGDRERHNYRTQIDSMLARDDLFEVAFRNEAILLLKVLQNGDGPARQQ
jgi:hypothetical protein